MGASWQSNPQHGVLVRSPDLQDPSGAPTSKRRWRTYLYLLLTLLVLALWLWRRRRQA